MKRRPVISVALCTHNGARFIEEQLLSILEQTIPPDEVVLSDDASTDNTVELVEQLWVGRRAAPELIVLRNSRALGVTANFEQAALACSGEYVALSDQDDVWAPDRLEYMVPILEASPDITLLFTDARLIDGSGEHLRASLFESLEVADADLREIRAGNALHVLLRRNLVTGATVIFRRELLDAAVPFDSAWVHDEWLAIVAAATGRVDFLPERLIGYRQHGDNQIGVTAPTLQYKVGRLFEPRGSRYEQLVDRADRLLKRFESLDVDDQSLAAVRKKRLHQLRRSRLPSARALRVIPVLREALTGRYAQFSSQGNLDIVRDLVQPDR